MVLDVLPLAEGGQVNAFHCWDTLCCVFVRAQAVRATARHAVSEARLVQGMVHDEFLGVKCVL